jgi:hypothetical protein
MAEPVALDGRLATMKTSPGRDFLLDFLHCYISAAKLATKRRK